MGLLGISLLVASVVIVIIRPPAWFWQWTRSFGGAPAITNGKTAAPRSRSEKSGTGSHTKRGIAPRIESQSEGGGEVVDLVPTLKKRVGEGSLSTREIDDKRVIPLPHTIPPPTIETPSISEPESPTTPKASAIPSSQPIPSFTLAEPAATITASSTPSLSMPPPPLPTSRPAGGRIPSLNQFPAANSAQRARGPAPNRGLAAPSSGLAPPPTHSSKPSKPSRKVVLTPGHSPLDWARISGPNCDLRGVPTSTPYLRVTPSMLKAQTGRKGTDAWMALNGKVYNITPYAKFHPGGVPELMRGAAKDGTRLFGEIHPWVNYESMLTACLVGLLVEEPVPGQESEMDKMD